MKIKNLILSLSKDDILSLIALQNKTIINELILEKDIKVKGIYKIVGFNIDFSTILSLNNYNNNIITLDVKDFQISNKSNSNPIVKRTIGFVVKSINDIDGMTLQNKVLKIDIENIVQVYCTEEYGVTLNKLEISTLTTKNNTLELEVKLIDISIS